MTLNRDPLLQILIIDGKKRWKESSIQALRRNWIRLAMVLTIVSFIFGFFIFSSPFLTMASPRPAFHWARSSPLQAHVSFLNIGDWGRAGNYNQSLIADQMGIVAKKTRSQFVVSNGDNFYDQGLVNAEDSFFIDSFSNIYTAPSLQIPWINVLGNHDYYGNVSAQLDPKITHEDWRWNCQKSGTFSKSLCSVRNGDQCKEVVQFFLFDTVPMVKEYRTKYHRTVDWTGIDTSDMDHYNAIQLQELSNNLAQSTARWKIVVGHHPVYSYGNHGHTQELIDNLKPLLEIYGVDLYLNGHDHNMQHIKMPDSPLHYFTSGGGSKAFSKVRPTVAEGLRFLWEGQGFASIEVTINELKVSFYGVGNNGPMYSTSLYKDKMSVQLVDDVE